MMTFETIAKTAGLTVASAIVGFGLCATAHAGSFKDKGGRVSFVPTSTEDTKLPDGSTLRKETSTGMTVNDLPFPFDYQKTVCTGTTHIAPDGKSGRLHGYCEVLSSKGDRAAYWYAGDFAGGLWGWMDGNGAYSGVKGGGTYKPIAFMPDGGGVNEWVGTWEND